MISVFAAERHGHFETLPAAADDPRYPRSYRRTFHWRSDGWFSDPRSPEALFSTWHRRWIGATVAAGIQAGAATLLSLEMAQRYGWLR